MNRELLRKRLTDFLIELEKVCKKCGRKTDQVKVVYATKYLDKEGFVTFLNICKEIDPSTPLGINIVTVMIGENRVQEAEEKFEFMKTNSPKLFEGLRRVMIGTLQTNKINKTIKLFDEIHSVDSVKLTNALDIRLKRDGKIMPIFLEVNVSGEESKHGFKPVELERVIRDLKLLKSPVSPAGGLKLKGLMTMASLVDDPEKVRPLFRKLRELADYYHLKTSMGMSNDWKIAIEEGTDMIRIGSKIFNVY